jgi:hypothetical protein
LKIAVALFALLVSAPAYAWENSRGNPSNYTGSSSLDNWSGTYKGGWGYDRFTTIQGVNYNNRAVTYSYSGKTYGVTVEGSFDTTGTLNDRMSISWGEVGSAAAKGFIGGGAITATLSADPRVIATRALAGGFVGAFTALWDNVYNTNITGAGPNHSGYTNNCPCTNDGSTVYD